MQGWKTSTLFRSKCSTSHHSGEDCGLQVNCVCIFFCCPGANKLWMSSSRALLLSLPRLFVFEPNQEGFQVVDFKLRAVLCNAEHRDTLYCYLNSSHPQTPLQGLSMCKIATPQSQKLYFLGQAMCHVLLSLWL